MADPDKAFRQSRLNLVEELCRQGISNSRVLEAMRLVPRHLFTGKDFTSLAYENRSLPIDCNQTISQPYVVACMIEALFTGASPEKILEVGTGSGYQTAVLASMSLRVFTVERIKTLHDAARKRLRRLEFQNVHFRCADGSRGWRQFAPFDGIIVSAASSGIPPSLLEQLVVGGRLIAPVGDRSCQHLTLVARTRHGFRKSRRDAVKFVPLVCG